MWDRLFLLKQEVTRDMKFTNTIGSQPISCPPHMHIVGGTYRDYLMLITYVSCKRMGHNEPFTCTSCIMLLILVGWWTFSNIQSVELMGFDRRHTSSNQLYHCVNHTQLHQMSLKRLAIIIFTNVSLYDCIIYLSDDLHCQWCGWAKG